MVLETFTLGILLSLGFSSLLTATSYVDVGQIDLLGGFPSGGLQQLEIFNNTGSGNCSTTYTVCDGVYFTNWALTVNYTDLSGSHQQTFNWGSSADDIAPFDGTTPYSGTPASQWTYDQSCTSGSCPPFDTVVTSATFTANLADSLDNPFTTFHLYPGGPGSTTFFAAPSFTVTFVPMSEQGQDPTAFQFFSSAELLVPDAGSSGGGPTPGVPEPSAVSLVFPGLAAVFGSRVLRCRRQSTL